MEKYISKSALVEELEKRRDKNTRNKLNLAAAFEDNYLLSFLNTLEVKDANEALRTEYEKGRADVIADTLSWLENCWPRYCSNQTIIDGYKEAIKYD